MQYMKQEPLIMAGPTLGIDKEDDDEACEIGSDDSKENDSNDDDGEEDKVVNPKQGGLHDSMRSSRTATFKAIKKAN